jgi:hypothetical protein
MASDDDDLRALLLRLEEVLGEGYGRTLMVLLVGEYRTSQLEQPQANIDS